MMTLKKVNVPRKTKKLVRAALSRYRRPRTVNERKRLLRYDAWFENQTTHCLWWLLRNGL